MKTAMNKYVIPDGRFPKPFNQDLPGSDVGSCVACTFTKILEVINCVKTGEYIELSKGYMYGRNNYAGKKNPGMSEEYTLDVLLKRGTVPVSICSDYGEIPDIVKILENRSDISELDKEAEKYALASWENISCNNYGQRFEKIKEYLQKYEMPLAGTIKKYKGEKHSVVIVGYDGDYILFHNHTGSDEIEKVKYERFSKAYYLDGGIEKMKTLNTEEFKKYISGLNVKRKIKRIQLHHTYSPSYKDFTGSNHEALQKSMRSYHMNTNGWSDIGQHFTIFSDGIIMTGRSIEATPAGIYGANTGAICVECVGNFDKGADVMTDAQKNAIVSVLKTLLDRFGLDVNYDVVYHAWYSADGRALGDYIKGHSVKTCPGTNFFGGNGVTAYEKNLLPLIENYGKEIAKMPLKSVTEINDIVWELSNAGIITDEKLWMQKCKDDINVYWLCRKIANKLRGTL